MKKYYAKGFVILEATDVEVELEENKNYTPQQIKDMLIEKAENMGLSWKPIVQGFEMGSKNLDPADPSLSLDYWDCECDKDYIHEVTEGMSERCERCGAYEEDMPNSRQVEVEEMLGGR